MVISFFYLLDRGKIWQASLIGILASSTRLVGIFLTASAFFKQKVKSKILLFIVPVGLISYMIYLAIRFNNPLYFLTSQQIFGQERSTTQIVLLPQVFWRYLKILSTTDGLPFVNALFELSSTLFALILLFIAYKKVKVEWVVFSALAVLVPTLTGTLASMPRYILVAFPIFIVLGMIKNLWTKILILIVFLVLQVAAITLFTQGYWVA